MHWSIHIYTPAYIYASAQVTIHTLKALRSRLVLRNTLVGVVAGLVGKEEHQEDLEGRDAECAGAVLHRRLDDRRRRPGTVGGSTLQACQ